jgi:prolyl-tRNA synthetase
MSEHQRVAQRQSQLFSKTRREAPRDEEAANAQLLIRAGYVHKEMAGVYSFLPLGLRTFTKIVDAIREEMDALGGQEIALTALQDPAPWHASGRWSDDVIDVWFKTDLAGGSAAGLGNTHEEPLTRLMTHHINSYKDLPAYVYQFQTKFRNELRAKSGLLRTREFVMKDLYSFNRSEEAFRAFYEQAAEAYLRVFDRLGVGDRTYRTYASGGSFSKFSDEFQTVSPAGEDTVYVHNDRSVAINEEIFTDDVLAELGFQRDAFTPQPAIEVGNIFPLGTKYAKALELYYTDENGQQQPVYMGSYGIGPGRLMAAIVETFADEKGIVWPKEIAPYTIHLVSLGTDKPAVHEEAERVYRTLKESGVEVLYDDRPVSAGEKFADADLLGLPYRAVISEKALEQGGIELTERASGDVRYVTSDELMNL